MAIIALIVTPLVINIIRKARITADKRSIAAYESDKTPQEPVIPTYTAYSVGDSVTYNNINYYVIKDSGSNEESVTLLKAEPLTAEEITDYKPSESQSYGNGMKYHSSSSTYSTSYVKTTVKAWAADKLDLEDLAADSTGYSVRLLNHDDLITYLGYINSLDT